MTRAIIIATDHNTDLAPLTHQRPGCMLPIGDKPIIHHILEELVRHGTSCLDVVLHDHPEQVEKYLEGGDRWGVTITYHLAKDPQLPLSSVVASSRTWTEETVLICSGIQLVNTHDLEQALASKTPPVRVTSEGAATGWMVLPTRLLTNTPGNTTIEELEAGLTNTVDIPTVVSVRDTSALLNSNKKLLDRKLAQHFSPSPTMVDDGIWIGRGVTIHPTAEIHPPVYIGPNTQVHAQSQIGPHAVVEGGCLLDRESTISDSVVLTHSFVGEGLEVRNSIIDRHQLVNLSLNTAITSTEDHILSDLAKPTLKRLFNQLLERVVATGLVAVFSPLIAYLILKHGTKKQSVVHLPTTLDPIGWRSVDWISLRDTTQIHRLLRWLVELINIAKGHAHFIGMPPRDREHLQQLDSDWKGRILSAKIGTITPGEAYGQDLEDTDQQFATESLYSAQMRYRQDLKLLIKFLWRSLTQRGSANAR